jgi:hypothetical protein
MLERTSLCTQEIIPIVLFIDMRAFSEITCPSIPDKSRLGQHFSRGDINLKVEDLEFWPDFAHLHVHLVVVKE